MRNFLLVVLAVTAICYYFDISPTDFLPTVQNSSPNKRERHSAAEQTAAAIAQPKPAAATTAITGSLDGSLASRWSPEPTPKKP